MSVKKWLQHELTTKKGILIFVFGCVVVFGLMAHAFGFLNLNLNHDYVTEYSLFGVTGWKLTIGRFMMPVVGVVLGEYVTMPWFSGVFALIMIALSVYLILKMFNLKRRWHVAVLSGLLVTNLAITALAASYMGDMVSDMFGLLLAVGAAYLWCKMRKKIKIGNLISCIVLVTLSTGCYQSHLSITIVLIIIKLVEDLLDGESAKEVSKRGLRGALPVLIGAVLYFVIANAVSVVNGLSLASGTTNSLSNVWMQDSSILSRIFNTYVYVLWALFAPAISPIPVSDNILPFSRVTWHTYAVCAINVFVLLFLVVSLIVYVRKVKMKTSARVLILVLLFIMPFLANVMHFLSGYSHILMQLPFVLYYLLFIVVVQKIDMASWASGFLKKVACYLAISTMVIVLVQVEYSNVIYTKKEIESKATLSTMTRMLSLIEEQDNYVFGETIVCPVGTDWATQVTLKEMENLAKVTGAESSSAISYQGAYSAYFQNVLLHPVNMCTTGQVQDIEVSDEYKEMKSFPDKDSIKTINDMIVIKMSDQ